MTPFGEAFERAFKAFRALRSVTAALAAPSLSAAVARLRDDYPSDTDADLEAEIQKVAGDETLSG